jgi:hypothetical protein
LEKVFSGVPFGWGISGKTRKRPGGNRKARTSNSNYSPLAENEPTPSYNFIFHA